MQSETRSPSGGDYSWFEKEKYRERSFVMGENLNNNNNNNNNNNSVCIC